MTTYLIFNTVLFAWAAKISFDKKMNWISKVYLLSMMAWSLYLLIGVF